MMAVFMIVAVVLVVTVTSVLFIRNTEHRKSDQLLLLLCETGERNLDYYFTSVEKSVKKMVSYTEKDLDGLEDDKLAAHTKRVESYFEEIANKTNGVLTYYYRIDPSVSSKVKGFWYTNLDGTDFVEHEVTDISQYDTEDTSKLVWFTVPKNLGTSIWLPPYITDNLDVRVISYNVPITYRGQFVGVIGIELDYSTMAEQVASIRLYSNGYAFLTDSDGRLIYHPRMDIASMPEEEKPATPEGALSENTFTSYTYDGMLKEAAWLRLSNGMRLYVSVPEEETRGEWKQLMNQVMIAGGIVALLSVLVTQFLAGGITKPLKHLTEAAIQADQGNYDFTVNYNGKDEVGVLTRTFRRMAEHTREHINDLNERANRDALTSVRNRGAFTKFIDEMQKKLDTGEIGPEFAIGMFDCDDLKTINDRYGHDKGDIYLKTASKLICITFQHSPVFRYGGDEFVVILRNDDFKYRDELMESFEKNRKRICEEAGNEWEQVHIAMGVAVFDPAQDHSVVDTMRRADKIMYVNKRTGKQQAAK
jgi:diguanylate cyclase (GGDEF)-like protein